MVEPTPLKNICQNGNLPQIGVKIKNLWNHHLVYNYICIYLSTCFSTYNNLWKISTLSQASKRLSHPQQFFGKKSQIPQLLQGSNTCGKGASSWVVTFFVTANRSTNSKPAASSQWVKLTHGKTDMSHKKKTGWWLNQPIWKILVKMGIFPR